MENAEEPGHGLTLAAVGVVLAAVVFVYPMALDIPLLDPDEGLHASIAQEMVERGDWVTPSLRGKPFLDKPILYFWAEALSLRLFGMREAAVRLPGLMFGLLGAVTTGIVGWRMFGRPVGLVAGLFYTTTILPAALAQAATHDVALIPWINLALLLFWESDRASTRRTAVGYTLAIGLLLGLTCLTKGLVGVALVGVAYGSYLLITRRLSVAICLRGAVALGVAALVASTWYIAVELRNPGYLHYYFVERHLLGYATGTQTHGDEAWWYYLPILLGGGLPWIIYLPVTIQESWARHKQAAGNDYTRAESDGNSSHGATVLLWCWLIGGMLFLSTSHSKLATYIWPLFPAVAILAAVPWVRLIEGTLSRGARRSILLTFGLSCLTGVGLLPIVMLVVQAKFAIQFSGLDWTVMILVAFGSWVSLGFLYAGRLRAMLSSGMLSVAAQYALIMTMVVPEVAAATSARELANHFNRLGRVPHRLLITEDRIGSLLFYLQRDLRAGLREDQLEEVLLEDLAKLPKAEPDTMVALPERRVDRAGDHFDLAGVDYQPVGRYRLYHAGELESRLLTAAAASTSTRR